MDIGSAARVLRQSSGLVVYVFDNKADALSTLRVTRGVAPSLSDSLGLGLCQGF